MGSLEIALGEMARRGKLVERVITLEKPELLNLFLTYQKEAMASRKFLESSLIGMNTGSEILEVGGGILALSVQLASEGFKVTVIEPIGDGFTGIYFIMRLYLEIASEEQLKFSLVESPIEDCTFSQKFDLIILINVMEHLKDPYSVSFQLAQTLKHTGKFRIFCPNYDFPYEPHFSKWIFSRKNGSFYLKAARASNPNIDLIDSIGLYKSINFVTLRKLCVFLNQSSISYEINSNAFYEILNRSMADTGLQNRHSGLYKLVLLIKKLHLLQTAKYFPKNFQPVIDMTIKKTKI